MPVTSCRTFIIPPISRWRKKPCTRLWDSFAMQSDTPRYFFPFEGTTLFGMAERFVDLYGYHGDGSLFDRALIFDNLNTLFYTMVLDEEYLQAGVDFPNFELSKVDLEQIAGHLFGDHLLRYNPKLEEAAWYKFPNLSQEYMATRPNTLVLSSITEFADKMEEDWEESDKENESL
ncbi:hypothetical protein DFH08DRAFT_807907 [Mycena albidolilacea]|uniref:Uncharacterized protein n=1 Tax=Mycena albidolilacea TaxID=1033008 RepID=A0AAD7A4N2_9AGAR|nr:hypothetical protein DFH08DRAFT_807907 [Mycena albidolilacea]